MRVVYSKRFLKQLEKSPRTVVVSFQKRLALFSQDAFHPLLNNHALTGEYRMYRSINITGDWRALFKELDNGEVVFFVLLGTHSQLYR